MKVAIVSTHVQQKVTPQTINASLQSMRVCLERPITDSLKTFIGRATAASIARKYNKAHG